MGISISFMPMVVDSTLSFVGSGQCIVAATNIYVIIFEVDIVGE